MVTGGCLEKRGLIPAVDAILNAEPLRDVRFVVQGGNNLGIILHLFSALALMHILHRSAETSHEI
jgi:hypothetical protein